MSSVKTSQAHKTSLSCYYHECKLLRICIVFILFIHLGFYELWTHKPKVKCDDNMKKAWCLICLSKLRYRVWYITNDILCNGIIQRPKEWQTSNVGQHIWFRYFSKKISTSVILLNWNFKANCEKPWNCTWPLYIRCMCDR